MSTPSDFPQPYDDVFLDLEDIKIDPYFEKVHEQARVLDSMLNAPELQVVSELALLEMDDKRKQALEKMNEECPFVHKVVAVSGTLVQPYWDELDREYKFEEKSYKREPLIAAGYATLKMDPSNQDRWVTGHVFYVGDTDTRQGSVNLVEETGVLYGFAPVGTLDIEYERPIEQTEEQLRIVLPDLMDCIDQVFEVSSDETEAIRNLGAVTIEKNTDIPHEVYEALMGYVWKRLNFDQEIPYTCVSKGVYLDSTNAEDDEEGTIECDADVERITLIRPGGLSLIPYYEKHADKLSESTDLHWYLGCFVAATNFGEPYAKFQIPVQNIITINSIRRTVYSANK